MTRRKPHSTKARDISTADIRVQTLPDQFRSEVLSATDKALYCITINGEILRTPGGLLIVHEDQRAIRELAAELDFTEKLDVTKISLYNLICTQIEFVQGGRQEFSDEMLTNAFLNDAVLKPCAGPEFIEQMKYLKTVVDYLKENNVEYPNLPQGPLDVDWLGEEPTNESFDHNFRRLVGLATETIAHLNDWEFTVFLTVAHVYSSPTLALMLAKKRVSPNEFAVMYYTSLAINSKVWGDTNRLEELALVEACTKHAECMIRYLDQFSPKLTEAEAILSKGESTTVEFKSTLRWNIEEGRKDSRIEHAVLKTVAAFLNTKGGTLIVGVTDDKNVLGIEVDGFENDDKYLLHFTNLVNARIGKSFTSLIDYGLQRANGGKVLLVNCRKSPERVSLKVGDENVFYIRTGPSTIQLTEAEMLEYWKTRD